MLVQSEIWTVAKTDQGNAILLRPAKAQVVVPIFIGQLEAQSILIGLGKIPMPRPNTHELLLSLLDKFQLQIKQIEITDIKEGVFIASIIIRGLNLNSDNPQQEEIWTHDARPSDALALAVRAKCPIYIAENIIDEAGIPLDNFTGKTEEFDLLNNLKVQNLKEALNKAIQEENYEEAARIRDILIVLEKEPPEYS